MTASEVAPVRLSPSRNDETLLEVVNVVLRQRRVVLTVCLVAGAAALVLSLLLPPTYTARTTFVPDASSAQARLTGGLSGLGGLAGLAGQLGVSLGGDVTRSPRFYADVAKSRQILEKVLLTRFPDRSASSGLDSAPLLRMLRVGGKDFADSLQRGVKRLGKQLDVRVDNQTGIVQLEVDARDAVLAASVANRFIELLNAFNTGTRQSRARERRKFVEERVAEGQRTLRQAEDELKRFYETNRSWQQAPQLVFEEGRLRRQVDVQQELYLTLRREYETARIEEVNDTPILTVVDSAAPPRRHSKPKTLVLTTLGLLSGVVLGIFAAFGVEHASRLRFHDEPGYREFRALLRNARSDLGALIGRRRR